MAIRLSKPEYSTIGKPNLEGLAFSAGSQYYRPEPEEKRPPWGRKEVKLFVGRKWVLQSLREAAAFRIEARGADYCEQEQVTRTVAVYFMDHGKRYVAFDDDRDVNNNIRIARAQTGYNACKRKGFWYLPMNDRHVTQILARAEKDGRIIHVTSKILKWKYWALKDEFTAHPIVKAALGDMTKPYARFLISKEFHYGHIGIPDETSGEKADIRAVVLGGDNCNTLDCIFARTPFHHQGRARLVRGSPEAMKWRA